MALDTSYWTVFNHITIWGSLVFYFILTFFYNFVTAGQHVGTLATAMREPVDTPLTMIDPNILLISDFLVHSAADHSGAHCPSCGMAVLYGQ